MTDDLLIQVEEKVISLLTEVETLRKEIEWVKEENALLKNEQDVHIKKLQGLVTLLDVVHEE